MHVKIFDRSYDFVVLVWEEIDRFHVTSSNKI